MFKVKYMQFLSLINNTKVTPFTGKMHERTKTRLAAVYSRSLQ